MAEVKNLSADEAERRLQEQLRPMSERTGEDVFAGDFERADAELERLENAVQIGHDAKRNK